MLSKGLSSLQKKRRCHSREGGNPVATTRERSTFGDATAPVDSRLHGNDSKGRNDRKVSSSVNKDRTLLSLGYSILNTLSGLRLRSAADARLVMTQPGGTRFL